MLSIVCIDYILWSLNTKILGVVKEAGRKPPPFPFIFFKPTTTIHDHGEPVVIPKIAQNDQADYEGELVCLMFSAGLLRNAGS